MATLDLDRFAHAYMVCALWSSTDEHGEPLDAVHSVDDLSDACRAAMRDDCTDFIAANRADLEAFCARMGNERWTGDAQAGHDFWLTRNGHGAGFWDRGLGDLGRRLSDASKVYGGVDLYSGDDGCVHC